jgi:L-amino acid N-acyltransferase YncA/2-polyprenyl-3-methyl-5-hydroxy-6-metoxy-1,4-benzoquinol methylase
MTDPREIDEQRAKVVDRYSGLARQAMAGQALTDANCLGGTPYLPDPTVPDTALHASLGCGNPLAVADIVPGETVLDLGSGGGLDVILSARRTGPAGKVYGLDASPDMLTLARTNARRAGIGNAEFVQGHIENDPLPDGHVDVVISNCVINLSADRPRVLAEAFRVLRPGGRLGITDLLSDEPEHATTEGGTSATAYRDQLLTAGFTAIVITPTHQVASGLSSATIQARKPAAPSGVTIRPMRAEDAAQVLAIYQAGIDTGNAGFETSAPTWDAFTAAKLPRHRHVAINGITDEVIGWVAVTAVSDRCVYAGVVEHSVYVHPEAYGRGIGGALLQALIDSTESAGIWTVQSGVFPENTASLHLHTKVGFRTVGTRHHVGHHHDRWRDVIILERRSTVTGTN